MRRSALSTAVIEETTQDWRKKPQRQQNQNQKRQKNERCTVEQKNTHNAFEINQSSKNDEEKRAKKTVCRRQFFFDLLHQFISFNQLVSVGAHWIFRNPKFRLLKRTLFRAFHAFLHAFPICICGFDAYVWWRWWYHRNRELAAFDANGTRHCHCERKGFSQPLVESEINFIFVI